VGDQFLNSKDLVKKLTSVQKLLNIEKDKSSKLQGTATKLMVEK